MTIIEMIEEIRWGMHKYYDLEQDKVAGLDVQEWYILEGKHDSVVTFLDKIKELIELVEVD